MCKSYQTRCSFPLVQLCCFGADVVLVPRIPFLINLLCQETTVLSMLGGHERWSRSLKGLDDSLKLL